MIEVSDEMRARALQLALAAAESRCQIPVDNAADIEARVDSILRVARECKLEPRLYRLAWTLRKWLAGGAHNP
jgi:hypothetical protein